jgi:hypothetical protein
MTEETTRYGIQNPPATDERNPHPSNPGYVGIVNPAAAPPTRKASALAYAQKHSEVLAFIAGLFSGSVLLILGGLIR